MCEVREILLCHLPARPEREYVGTHDPVELGVDSAALLIQSGHVNSHDYFLGFRICTRPGCLRGLRMSRRSTSNLYSSSSGSSSCSRSSMSANMPRAVLIGFGGGGACLRAGFSSGLPITWLTGSPGRKSTAVVTIRPRPPLARQRCRHSHASPAGCPRPCPARPRRG